MGIFVKRRVCVESQRLCECSSHRPSDGCGLGNCALKYKSVLKVGVSVSVSVSIAGGGDEGGMLVVGDKVNTPQIRCY